MIHGALKLCRVGSKGLLRLREQDPAVEVNSPEREMKGPMGVNPQARSSLRHQTIRRERISLLWKSKILDSLHVLFIS